MNRWVGTAEYTSCACLKSNSKHWGKVFNLAYALKFANTSRGFSSEFGHFSFPNAKTDFLLSCFFTDYTTIENYWFLTKGTNSCSEEFMIFKTDIVDSITIGNVLANPSHSNPRKAEKSSKGPWWKWCWSWRRRYQTKFKACCRVQCWYIPSYGNRPWVVGRSFNDYWHGVHRKCLFIGFLIFVAC